MAVFIRFAKLHLSKPQDSWNNGLWVEKNTSSEHVIATESTVNSYVYKSAVESNVRQFVRLLRLDRNWVMQQDNKPK